MQLVLGGLAERRRVERNRVIVENGQGRVEVIEAGVDQLEGDHRHAQRRGDLRVSAQVGAKAVAGQHHFADHQKIALTLVDVTGGYRRKAH